MPCSTKTPEFLFIFCRIKKGPLEDMPGDWLIIKQPLFSD